MRSERREGLQHRKARETGWAYWEIELTGTPESEAGKRMGATGNRERNRALTQPRRMIRTNAPGRLELT